MSAQYQINVCPMSAQCLPNVCPMSAQCPQFPLNVPYVCLMFLISAQCPICLPNVPNFCPMSFAVKSRISFDMLHIKMTMELPKCLKKNVVFRKVHSTESLLDSSLMYILSQVLIELDI